MSYLVLFVIILFFIVFIIGIAILLSFYADRAERSALEGLFFLRSLVDPFGSPSYLIYDSGNGDAKVMNDNTEQCQYYSWSYKNNKIISAANPINNNVIFVSSPIAAGPVKVGNPGSTDLSDWQYDFNSQSFCLLNSNYCLYNNNGVAEIREFVVGQLGFGWLPESSTKDKICT